MASWISGMDWGRSLGGLVSGLVRSGIPGLDLFDPVRAVGVQNVLQKAASAGVPWEALSRSLGNVGMEQEAETLGKRYAYEYNWQMTNQMFGDLERDVFITPELASERGFDMPTIQSNLEGAFQHRVAVNYTDALGEQHISYFTIRNDEPLTKAQIEGAGWDEIFSGDWSEYLEEEWGEVEVNSVDYAGTQMVQGFEW